jgi:hypothetical protein
MSTQAGRRYVESFDRAHRNTDFFLINGLAEEAAEAVAAIEDEISAPLELRIARLEEALEQARDPIFEPHGPIVRKWWRLGWLSCRAVLADALTPAPAAAASDDSSEQAGLS